LDSAIIRNIGGISMNTASQRWTMEISNTRFENNTGTHALYIPMSYRGPTLLEGNSFINNDCGSSATDCYTLYYAGFNDLTQQLTVRGNEFVGNRARTVIAYINVAPISTLMSLVTSNTFTDNQALATTYVNEGVSGGVTVAVFGQLIAFDNNFFQNDNFNGFELAMMSSVNATVNATNNWWGSAQTTAVAARIFDSADLSTRATVLYEPFLLSATWDCGERNNCSDHGQCIRSQFCDCNDGWEGLNCDVPTCRLGAYNCFDRGDCIGPNTCNVSERRSVAGAER
jgi:hypothetical protein